MPEAPATTWLEPLQTHGKQKPYLFTQGQACLNRSLFPCMDTPAVRFTYDAVLHVPQGFTAVMSAEVCGAASAEAVSESPAAKHFKGAYHSLKFDMRQPIPSYLVAMAVGDLTSKPIGPRSKVWCEPSQLDAAVQEFDGMPEKYLLAAEKLYGPYRWDTYDLVVMPPSFPFGGMENPRMTFITPCLLAGDRSLGDVIAHEIAHSWFGNLVTNANWSEFWLNEGFTMFSQRRITDEVHGKAFTALEATTGRKILEDDVKEFGDTSNLTKLRCPIEAGVDPEDTYNETPYEKGFAMVSFLRHVVDSEEAFDAWLLQYCQKFAFQSIIAEDMFEYFFASFPGCKGKIDVEDWLHTPGMPKWLPDLSVGTQLLEPVEGLLKAFDEAGSEPAAIEPLLARAPEVREWITYQKLHFLDRLLTLEKLSAQMVSSIGDVYGFLGSGNAEIRLRYGLVIVERKAEQHYSYVSDFLRVQGKQKYTLPLYRALCRQEGPAREVASKTWAETRDCLHPNVRRAVAKALEEAGMASEA
eukprot:TRINITY_DN33992_c0_g1_i1.p1 TRINITY_DN33992_c0_g1~~TRINITY_DN33992_c0_g1_i1.p1  ORF type:complete len:557 (-),score=114.30 TRINITY_DN33992_c0_g1_i1:318-1892(-)